MLCQKRGEKKTTPLLNKIPTNPQNQLKTSSLLLYILTNNKRFPRNKHFRVRLGTTLHTFVVFSFYKRTLATYKSIPN